MNDPKVELYTYDLTEAIWRKASASGPEHNCVEVTDLPGGGKAVRDSKRPDAAPLRYTASEWEAFRQGVIAGEL
ncbi:DUF397 domain-containing protein [Streptomyces verrucosisporus]|uniref:DUF397 domain-containing protein n=1 Tax=Streptomyces verrucosisporus TaxID=1695161 RepID=UPI0019D1724B|nr:DUF397 domain-containing protein [Streptomyces verrucosisporus]MBN3930698.1 DUF397 domain-containing protein [Streptomyces verrucosisporus]